MHPGHPGWKGFSKALSGPDGCNFKKPEGGEMTWKCAGGSDQSLATKILSKTKGINVTDSLLYFRDHGGHCDCEILFNVERQGS